MAREIVFVATEEKRLRVGQRLFLDGWLADVPRPARWREWPYGEFARWVAHREPIKIFLWAGPPFTRSAALGEVRDPGLIEELYRWHLTNVEMQIAIDEAYSRKHPDRYRRLRWKCQYITNWGNSLEFLKTFAARVHWINVYDPARSQMGIHVELLTDKDARRFIRISEAKRLMREAWLPVKTLALVGALMLIVYLVQNIL